MPYTKRGLQFYSPPKHDTLHGSPLHLCFCWHFHHHCVWVLGLPFLLLFSYRTIHRAELSHNDLVGVGKISFCLNFESFCLRDSTILLTYYSVAAHQEPLIISGSRTLRESTLQHTFSFQFVPLCFELLLGSSSSFSIVPVRNETMCFSVIEGLCRLAKFPWFCFFF